MCGGRVPVWTVRSGLIPRALETLVMRTKSRLHQVYALLSAWDRMGVLEPGQLERIVSTLKEADHALATKNHRQARKALDEFLSEFVCLPTTIR
jgi:hypothetical protein